MHESRGVRNVRAPGGYGPSLDSGAGYATGGIGAEAISAPVTPMGRSTREYMLMTHEGAAMNRQPPGAFRYRQKYDGV